MKFRYILLAFFACVLIALSCNDNSTSSEPDPPEPPPPENPDRVSEDIGPDGGAITSKDGTLTLTIPAGALGNTETITVETITEDDLGSEFDELVGALGFENAWELGPDGLQFNQPITARFQTDQTPAQTADSLGAFAEFFFISDGETLEALDSLRVDTDVENNTVTISGQLTHFSQLFEPVQVSNGVFFSVRDVPEMLEVDNIFDADVIIATTSEGALGGLTSLAGPARYLDGADAPLVATFDGAPNVDIPIDENAPDQTDTRYRGQFSYTCTEDGPALFFTEMRIGVQFDLDSGPILAETFSFFARPVECVESEVNVQVTLEGDGFGTVNSDPAGIDCPDGDCEALYTEGAMVTLTAIPDEGSVFVGWGGEAPDECTTQTDCTITASIIENEITATFGQAETQTFTLNVQKDGSGNGSVTSDPPGIDFGDDNTEDYEEGTEVTLTATPADGSEFVNWSGDIGDATPEDSVITVTMDQARTVTATFNMESTTEAPQINTFTGSPLDQLTVGYEAKFEFSGNPNKVETEIRFGDGNTTSTEFQEMEAGMFSISLEYEFPNTGNFTSVFTARDTETGESDSQSLEINEVTVTVEKQGNGDGDVFDEFDVDDFPVQGILIDCAPGCRADSGENLVISNGEETIGLPFTLVANPDENSIFTGWDGQTGGGEGCNESDPAGGKCEVVGDMDREIIPTFEQQNTGNALPLGAWSIPGLSMNEAPEKLFIDAIFGGGSSAPKSKFPSISQEETQFGNLTDTFPVAIAGAEGFVVVDLLTGDVLFDAAGAPLFIEGPPLFGVIGLSEEPPGPNSAHAFYYFGENGINAIDTQGECCTQQANQPPAFDAVPAGGTLYSGYAVTVATDGINFIFYDEQQDLYRQTFFSESGIPANRFSGQPISAWMPDDGTPEDTPVLVLTRETESGVYLTNRDGSEPVRAIDNIGFDARKLRCIDDGSGNLVCAASIFGHDRLGLLTWDGENLPTLTDFAEVGGGPVGIDMRLLDNGNIAVVSTGFNDNTVTVTIVAPNGIVQSSNTQPVPEGCQSPGHAIFVQDAESLKIVGTCFNSSNYFIMESEL